MAEIVDIRDAPSFVPMHDRWVGAAAIMEHFSLSEKTIQNYTAGSYRKNQLQHEYPQGPMPHLVLPGGGKRYKIAECEAWIRGEELDRRPV